jgi:predicted DNA-binding transcriptional regulator
MVSKDQAIGGVIFLVCVLVALFYVITLFSPDWLNIVGLNITSKEIPNVRFWIVAIPVFLAFILVLGIGAWIGWTMATTPPPKPIEELELEEETSESKEEKEKEETRKKK